MVFALVGDSTMTSFCPALMAPYIHRFLGPGQAARIVKKAHFTVFKVIKMVDRCSNLLKIHYLREARPARQKST